MFGATLRLPIGVSMNLRRLIALSALQQYGRYVIMFGTSVVVARLLTPAEMGVFAVSMGIIGLLEALRTMGIGSYFISLPTITTEDLRLYSGLSWILSLAFAALLVALSWWTSAIYADPLVGTSLRILAIAHALSALGVVPNLILMREMRFDRMLLIGLATSAVQTVTVVALAYLGAGPLSLAWGQVTSTLATSLGSVLCVPAMAWVRPSLHRWRRPFGFGGWLTATTISGSIGMQAAELIIGRVLGLASTALYSRALGLAGIVRTLFYGAATQPALPAFVRAQREDAGGLARLYLRFVAVITGLSWPAYAVLAIWGEPVTVLLYGETWRPAAALLPMICLGGILACAAMPYHQVLVARQCVRLLFLCETVLLLNWLALLLISAQLGLQAVAWAYVVGSFVAVIVYIVALRHVIGLRLRDIAAAWWRSGVPAFAAAAVAAAMRISDISDSWPLPIVLVLTGAACGLAWLGAIWLVRHEFRGHAMDIAAAVARRLARGR